MAHTIVIFGFRRPDQPQTDPRAYELYRKKRLPQDTRIVGFSRTKFTDESWREKLAGTTAHFVGKNFDAALWQQFAASIYFHPGDIGTAADFSALGTLPCRPGRRAIRHAGVLPFHGAAVVCHRVDAAWRGRAGQRGPRPPPGRDRKALRHRSGHRPGTQRPGPSRSSPNTRSTASTTTWARRRCRTCWCCGLPTASSSRSGTATTSTTCRSRRPRN